MFQRETEAEDLESAAIGEDRAIPAHEFVQPAEFFYQGRTRRAARRHLLRPGYALSVLPGVAPPLAV